jgi:hypothetical protein
MEETALSQRDLLLSKGQWEVDRAEVVSIVIMLLVDPVVPVEVEMDVVLIIMVELSARDLGR